MSARLPSWEGRITVVPQDASWHAEGLVVVDYVGWITLSGEEYGPEDSERRAK